MSSFIAVHVGAGSHSESSRPNLKELMRNALREGHKQLKKGGGAAEIVELCISILEDCDLTNAGRGSSLTNKGTVECDASIMDGKTLQYGAVGAVSGVINPISLAAKVLTEQNKKILGDLVPPMLLVGRGAREWAQEKDIVTCDPRNLVAGRALSLHKQCTRHLKRLGREANRQSSVASQEADQQKPPSVDGCKNDDQQSQAMEQDEHNEGNLLTTNKEGRLLTTNNDSEDDTTKRRRVEVSDKEENIGDGDSLLKSRMDTVGCVVVDASGHVAAGVSSGGLLLKTPGRVGQAGVYGAGCWAENDCNGSGSNIAVSSSGCGEQLVSAMLAVNTARTLSSINDPLDSSLVPSIRATFLDSKFIRGDRKIGGCIMVKHSPEECNTDFYCFHSSVSMGFGYIGAKYKSPKVKFTNLKETMEGRDLTLYFSSYHNG